MREEGEEGEEMGFDVASTILLLRYRIDRGTLRQIQDTGEDNLLIGLEAIQHGIVVTLDCS
jgi:hypothetical protein